MIKHARQWWHADCVISNGTAITLAVLVLIHVVEIGVEMARSLT